MKTVKVLQVIIAGLLLGLAAGCEKKTDLGQKATACETPAASAESKPAPVAPAPAVAEKAPAAEAVKEKKEKKADKLIVVTNETNYQLDKDILNFITTRGVPLERVVPADFEKYKGEKCILVLGGPNDAEGLGDAVKQLLSPQEVEFVSQMGNKELYLKTDKWSSGQYILVIAGCDADATYRQFVNSKDKWWGYISSWFNIELSHDEVYGY
jgi:hypothetical protein